mmetsp:Transcript_65541/g.207130  ORF Transcript_65541/g.207130 Transcript_65541/m.207130 type:complete len:247 (+) Transcript_65541:317-1057(+)
MRKHLGEQDRHRLVVQQLACEDRGRPNEEGGGDDAVLRDRGGDASHGANESCELQGLDYYEERQREEEDLPRHALQGRKSEALHAIDPQHVHHRVGQERKAAGDRHGDPELHPVQVVQGREAQGERQPPSADPRMRPEHRRSQRLDLGRLRALRSLQARIAVPEMALWLLWARPPQEAQAHHGHGDEAAHDARRGQGEEVAAKREPCGPCGDDVGWVAYEQADGPDVRGGKLQIQEGERVIALLPA